MRVQRPQRDRLQRLLDARPANPSYAESELVAHLPTAFCRAVPASRGQLGLLRTPVQSSPGTPRTPVRSAFPRTSKPSRALAVAPDISIWTRRSRRCLHRFEAKPHEKEQRLPVGARRQPWDTPVKPPWVPSGAVTVPCQPTRPSHRLRLLRLPKPSAGWM